MTIAMETNGTSGEVEKTPLERIKALAEVVDQCYPLVYEMPRKGEGFELYNVNPKIAEICKTFRKRIHDTMVSTLRSAGFDCRANIPPQLESIEELAPAFDFLLDRAAIDTEIHINLDKEEQFVKGPDGKLRPATDPAAASAGRYAKLARGELVDPKRVIAKPQAAFRDAIVNDDAPFVPKLPVKHNALRTRTAGITVSSNDEPADRREWLSDADGSQHPYARELLHFRVPERQLEISPEQPPLPLNETPLVMVDDEQKLKELVRTLNGVSEFAVDVEHHEFRSFLGLTCLLQISTRTADFIVDPFPIWLQLHLLNEPFSNPNILKVFHGSDSDLMWLQRNFGIYVVNMLDTYIFMRKLEWPKRSLQALVSKVCGVELDKSFQRADWRERPLDEGRIVYARSDSHYLLHCCDRLIRDLKQRPKLNLMDVYEECRTLCLKASSLDQSSSNSRLKAFEQPRFDPNGYERLLERSRRVLNSRQLFALRRLWAWRDEVARNEDESIQYVLPDHMLLYLADTLPREIQGIISCCSPLPSLVKRDVHRIHQIMKMARDQPLEEKPTVLQAELSGAAILESIRARQLQANRYTSEVARLDCRFDQNQFKVDDRRPSFDERVAALFEGRSLEITIGEKKKQPLLPLRRAPAGRTNSIGRAEKIRSKMGEWATPYDCYLVAMSELEKEQLQRKQAEEKEAAKVAAAKKAAEVQIKVEPEEEEMDVQAVPAQPYRQKRGRGSGAAMSEAKRKRKA